MKIFFAGTPQFALPSLKLLHEESSHSVCAVLCNTDTGRGRKFTPSPVKEYAEKMQLPVFQTDSLDAEFREKIAEFGAELLVVAAYGRIFGPKFMALFPRGGINVHPSLLPKFRGPSPISASILSGEREAGISIQYIAEKMDAGDIILQEAFPLGAHDNAQTLSDYCSERGAELCVRACDYIEAAAVQAQAQNEADATYCSLITQNDYRINWDNSAEYISRLVRAYLPHARTSWKGRNVKILEAVHVDDTWEAASVYTRSALNGTVVGVLRGADPLRGILVQTSAGMLCVQTLQLQTKRAMHWKDFINGHKDFIGSVLQ